MVSATAATAVLAVIAVVFTLASVFLGLAWCKFRGKCGFRAWRPRLVQQRRNKGRQGLHSYGVPSVPTSPYSIIYEETQMEESWFQSGVYEDVGQPITRDREKDQSNVSLISVSRIGIDSTFNPAPGAPLELPSEGYYNPGFEKDTIVVKEVERPSTTADKLEGKNQSVTGEIVYARVNKEKKRCKSDVPTSEPIYARVDVSMKKKFRTKSLQVPLQTIEIEESNSHDPIVKDLQTPIEEAEEPGYAKLDELELIKDKPNPNPN